MTKCSNCGAEYANAVPKFCSTCGKPMVQQSAPQQAPVQNQTVQQPQQQIQNTNQQAPQAVMTPPQPQQAQNGFPMPQNNVPNQNRPPQNMQNQFNGQSGQMGFGAAPVQNQQNFYSQPGSQPNVQQNNFKPEPKASDEDDKKSAVLGTGGFFLTTFLCSIPIIGFIMTIIWGIGAGKTNLNRRNYCRSMMLMWIISILLTAITGAIVGVAITPMLEDLLAVLQESATIY